jgi:hypothetical protein
VRKPSKRTQPGRKRSFQVPLLWIGAAALIGFPILRDATADPMQRAVYWDRESCECDYGAGRCSLQDARWVGPWYARKDADRKADDPGVSGQCVTSGRAGHYFYGSAGYTGASGYRGPRAVENGHRGGFGGTGRVRSAAS